MSNDINTCTPKPWQQRVIDERVDLHHKIEQLEAFIDSPEFSALQVLDQGYLARQRSIMREYWQVLDNRIARFGA